MATDNNIRQKIILEGEQEYKKALQDATRNLKTLRSELKAESAELGKNATVTEKAEVKNKNLQKQIKEQEKVVETYRKALVEVREKYGDNEEAVAKWEQKLNEARATLANMKNGLEDVGTEMQKVQTKTSQAKTESKSLADSFDRFKEVGQNVSQALESIFNGLLGGIKDTISEVWTLIAETASKADRWGDLAGFYGATAEQIQELDRAITATGSNFEDFVSLMTQLEFRGKDKKLVEWLGISSENYENQLDYAVLAMNQLVQKKEELGAAKFNEKLGEVFGGRSMGIIELIDKWDLIKAKQAELKETGYLLDEGEIDTMSQVQAMLASIELKWDSLKTKFAEGFGKVTLTIGTKVEGALDALAKYFDAESDEEREKALTELEENIKGVFEAVKKAIQDGLDAVEGLAENLEESENPVFQAIGIVLGGLSSALRSLTDEEKSWTERVEGFFDGIKKAIQGGLDLIDGFAESLKESDNPVISMIGHILGGLTSSLKWLTNEDATWEEKIGGIFSSIAETIRGCLDTLDGLAEELQNSENPIIQVIGHILGGLTSALTWLTKEDATWEEKVGGIFKSIVEAIRGCIDTLDGLAEELQNSESPIMQIIGHILGGLTSALTWLTKEDATWEEKVQGVFSGIAEMIRGCLDTLDGLAEELQNSENPIIQVIGHILSGLTSALTWLTKEDATWEEKVKGIFKSIVGAIRDCLDVVDGLAEEMKESENPIIQVIGTILGGLTSALKWLTDEDATWEEKVKGIFESIKTAIKEGAKLLEDLAEDLKKSDDPLVSALGTILGGLVDALKWFTQANANEVVAAFGIIATFWTAGKGLALASTISKLAVNIKTLQAFKLGSGVLGLGNLAGAAAGAAGDAVGLTAALNSLPGILGGLGGTIATALTSATIVTSLAAILCWPVIKTYLGEIIHGEKPTITGLAKILGKDKAEQIEQMNPSLTETVKSWLTTPSDQKKEVNRRAINGIFGIFTKQGWSNITEGIDTGANDEKGDGAGMKQTYVTGSGVPSPHGRTKFEVTENQKAAAEAFWDVYREGDLDNWDAAYEAFEAAFAGQEEEFERIQKLMDQTIELLDKDNHSTNGTNASDWMDLPATWWKNTDSGGNGLTSDDIRGFNALPAMMRAAVQAGISNIKVVMDGQTVGNLVTPFVSQNIARDIP